MRTIAIDMPIKSVDWNMVAKENRKQWKVIDKESTVGKTFFNKLNGHPVEEVLILEVDGQAAPGSNACKVCNAKGIVRTATWNQIKECKVPLYTKTGTADTSFINVPKDCGIEFDKPIENHDYDAYIEKLVAHIAGRKESKAEVKVEEPAKQPLIVPITEPVCDDTLDEEYWALLSAARTVRVLWWKLKVKTFMWDGKAHCVIAWTKRGLERKIGKIVGQG